MDCGRSRAASNDHRVGTFLLARQKDDRRPQISPESNGAEGLARANCATFAALRKGRRRSISIHSHEGSRQIGIQFPPDFSEYPG